MAEPSDQELYNKSKSEVDKNYDKPSAYRSMAYTRTYLKNYREKYGDDKKAYKGKNPENLKTWRREKWVDVKSFLQNPKSPTACGNAPIKKGEYPLCMPIDDIKKYNRSELSLLVKRKNEIGKRRLVKDAYLRDVLEPENITPIREYKDKYVKEKPVKVVAEKPEVKKEPKVVLSAEQKKEAKNQAQMIRDEAKRTAKREAKAVKALAESISKPAADEIKETKTTKEKPKRTFPSRERPPEFKIEYGEVNPFADFR
jgi:hypothetical protein